MENVRVHLIGDPENVEHRLPAKDIKPVGNEGARRGIAILPDGREVPIYNIIEWGWLWEEQESTHYGTCVECERLAILNSAGVCEGCVMQAVIDQQ